MLATLPYELPELVTRAPLDVHASTVLPEWVDWNGHMNVGLYVVAFDKATGKLLWEGQLPAAGNTTPSTYMVNGRQYIVIACGGGKNGAPSGGTYVAFALP